MSAEAKRLIQMDQFGLFQDDEKGPMWRASFSDLKKATLQAQKSADNEQVEFFVYSFRTFTEIARVAPTQPRQNSKERRTASQLSSTG